MPDIWNDVDTAVQVPVSLMPLVDRTDFITIEDAIAHDETGMAVAWNFVTTAGVMTTTAVTPTTAGVHDWLEEGTNQGMYSIEIPDTGGTVNNDTEGFGWISGETSSCLPFRGPMVGFRAAALNDALLDGGDTLDVNVTTVTSAAQNSIADALLKRDWTAVSGEAARSVLNALRFLRNKWSISGTTLTVTEEDDSTAAWTSTVVTDASANPITESDPA